MAAALAVQRGTVPDLSVAWLVGVARHKLVDHWRHQAMAERSLTLLDGGASRTGRPGPGDRRRGGRAPAARLAAPDYRTVLTLRYLDDLSVPETADLIGRSVHATESLLVRARVRVP